MPPQSPATRQTGLPFALGAHLIWGLLPLYLRLVHAVPAVEFVGWRVLFTLPLCALFIAARGQKNELIAALTNWKVLRMLVLSALLIGTNWLVYVMAIQSSHVFAASFGYYLTPLLQVLAGTVFLHERLSALQWAAVLLAGLGVVLLGWGELDMLGVSLAMALSWLCYGFVRKVTPVGSVPGLTIETLVLAPLAVLIVSWFAATPQGSSFGHAAGQSLLIACAGLVTAVPLLFFAIAARRMDFTVLGMLQFVSPTIVFGLGVTVFGKPLDPLQLGSFAIIWTAIALFVWDLLVRRGKAGT
ncbi:EamA family transporter RarD [Novosphingobium sp.]|uniref:EamA family transporter RarD n=1 Tax=Novosphingobium sp. TaxID=1874826 RepID=UPI0035B493C2